MSQPAKLSEGLVLEIAGQAPGLLVRIDESGHETAGRFTNRQFQPVKTKFTP